MLRYIVDLEDSVTVHPGAERVLELFSGARMMAFSLDAIREAATVRAVPVDRTQQTALRLVAEDALLGRTYELFLPQSHRDFATCATALAAARPDLELTREMAFTPPACDGSGHHHD